MSKEREWIVYGAGGFGREVAWLIRRRGEHIVSFVDDRATGAEYLSGRPVSADMANAPRTHPRAVVVIAVAEGAVRARLADRVRALGGTCPALVDPTVELDEESVEVGEGSIVCARAVLSVDVKVGRFVHINLGCTVGHDAVLNDFVTLAPGVHLSGRVVIGKGATLGTGVAMIQGRDGSPLVVGEGAVVGAQACVVRPVPDGVTWVGVPARPSIRSTPKT